MIDEKVKQMKCIQRTRLKKKTEPKGTKGRKEQNEMNPLA